MIINLTFRAFHTIVVIDNSHYFIKFASNIGVALCRWVGEEVEMLETLQMSPALPSKPTHSDIKRGKYTAHVSAGSDHVDSWTEGDPIAARVCTKGLAAKIARYEARVLACA